MGMLGSVSCAPRHGARQSDNSTAAKLYWSDFVRQENRLDPFRMSFPDSERAKKPSANFQQILQGGSVPHTFLGTKWLQ
jgi:hypothetical protein